MFQLSRDSGTGLLRTKNQPRRDHGSFVSARNCANHPAMHRVFLLSPAHCGGLRARMVYRPNAQLDLARRLQDGGASLSEVFTFLSGLYFRGKIAYATAFAQPPRNVPGIFVITPNRGL